MAKAESPALSPARLQYEANCNYERLIASLYGIVVFGAVVIVDGISVDKEAPSILPASLAGLAVSAGLGIVSLVVGARKSTEDGLFRGFFSYIDTKYHDRTGQFFTRKNLYRNPSTPSSD